MSCVNRVLLSAQAALTPKPTAEPAGGLLISRAVILVLVLALVIVLGLLYFKNRKPVGSGEYEQPR